MKNIFGIVTVVLFIQNVYCQGDITPKYSNDFLAIGVGAAALGQSNSVVAGVNDVTAGYWNPAGLTDVTDFLQIGAMHAEYFAGIAKYDYLGVAKPLDDLSTLGFTFIRLGVDDIPNTTQLFDPSGNIDYDNITTFNVGDYAFLFSYARKMPIKGLSVGGNFKVIYRHAGNFAKGWGFGLDAAAIYKLNDHWRFGAVIRDVTTTINAWSYNLDDQMIETFQQTNNEIPQNGFEITMPRIIMGAQFKTNVFKELYVSSEINATLNTDGRRNVLIRTSPFSIDPSIGIELGYGKWVALRAGFGNYQWIKNTDLSESLTFQPNIGIGVGFKSVKIDYAFTDIGDVSVALYSHVFSLRFGLSDPKKKEDKISNSE
ncbi:MAG: PorV/PorQ family protein [Crocinitomicaceae bacterium]